MFQGVDAELVFRNCQRHSCTWDAFDDGRTVHFDENDASGNERSITYAKADGNERSITYAKADGNGVGTTSITPARVGRTFTHDAWNRLTESKANAPGLVLRDVDYAYDALGRMITHQSGSRATDLYHSTSWQILTEVDTNAQSQVTEVRDNVWSLAYVDAMVFQEKRDAATPGGERTYPLHDANYNVTALLREVDDGEGGTEWQVTTRYVYDPYGTATKLNLGAEVDTSDSDWNYLHQGGYLTDADRLYHFRHRSYDPSNGQWIQRDPVLYADGLNLHEGLMSNPVSYVDALGLAANRDLPYKPGWWGWIPGPGWAYTVGYGASNLVYNWRQTAGPATDKSISGREAAFAAAADPNAEVPKTAGKGLEAGIRSAKKTGLEAMNNAPGVASTGPTSGLVFRAGPRAKPTAVAGRNAARRGGSAELLRGLRDVDNFTALPPHRLQKAGDVCGLYCGGSILDEIAKNRRFTDLDTGWGRTVTRELIRNQGTSDKGIASNILTEWLNTNLGNKHIAIIERGVTASQFERMASRTSHVIAHVDGNHFVRVLSVRDVGDQKWVKIYDPARGTYEQLLTSFVTRTGVNNEVIEVRSILSGKRP